MESNRVISATFITYDSLNVKFYIVEKTGFPWQKQKVTVKELGRWLGSRIEDCMFYYACDRNPVIADTHRFYLLNQPSPMTFDTIMPASLFGFCRVMKNGKWGMVKIQGDVSMEIECKYDRIVDVSEIGIPGPGPGGPYFLGTIGELGERTDFYQLFPDGHLCLKTCMTKAQIAVCSHFT